MALATDPARMAAKEEVGYRSAPWRVAIQQEVGVLLRFVTTLAESRGLQYFAINGTLLGATKFQGMIPWEDDADLGIFLEEVGAWKTALLQVLPSTQYTLTECTYGWVLSGPHKGMLDLIVFGQHSRDGLYRMAYPLANGIPTYWMSLIRIYEFPPRELLPLRKYRYDDLLLWGPAEGQAICLRTYGENVYTVNRRPDGGCGIHPHWPTIARTLNPVSQGCANWLAQHCPRLVEQLAAKRRKKQGVSVSPDIAS
jgi:hypothetical protein